MAPEEMNLVPAQRMENGLNSQMVFQDETLQFSGRRTREMSGFEDEKIFSVEREQFFRSPPEAEFRRNIFDTSPGRQEQPENQNWNNGDESNGTPSGDGSQEEEDDDDDDDVGEGDGEVEVFVPSDDGNSKNNNSSSSVRSSSGKLRKDKGNLQAHHSSFGSSSGVLVENNFVHSNNNIRSSPNEQQQEFQQLRQPGRANHLDNAAAIAERDMYYIHFPQGSDGPSLAQKEMDGDNGCGFSGRKDASLSSESGDPLRAIFSDPITGSLMDDAMILPCGHSFGSGGMQHVLRMKSCFTCSQPVSDDLVAPNLSLRSAVQAFRREEEMLSSRSLKRRRDRLEQDKCDYGDPFPVETSRGKGVQFPFTVTDRVIIKGNKRTPQRFVGREAVVTTQCLNGCTTTWYKSKKSVEWVFYKFQLEFGHPSSNSYWNNFLEIQQYDDQSQAMTFFMYSIFIFPCLQPPYQSSPPSNNSGCTFASFSQPGDLYLTWVFLENVDSETSGFWELVSCDGLRALLPIYHDIPSL